MLSLNEFQKRIRSGKPDGWYIFAGEEDYLKRFYLSELRRAALGDDEDTALFNLASFDSDNMDIAAAREAIESPPMMGDYKFVEWKFADLTSLRESEIKKLTETLFPLKEEYPNAIFAILTTSDGFDLGTEKRPGKSVKIFGEAFDVLSFGKSTDAQLLSWLKKHFDAEGIKVTAEVLGVMLLHVGHSMEVLNNEVIKLSCYLKANGRDTLTPEDVEEASVTMTECDAFAIQNAVIEGDVKKAFRALLDMKERRTEAQVVIGMLSKTYSELISVALLAKEGQSISDIRALLGMHEFKVRLYVNAAKKLGIQKISESLDDLLEADTAAKQGGVSGYSAIELFITKNI